MVGSRTGENGSVSENASRSYPVGRRSGLRLACHVPGNSGFVGAAAGRCHQQSIAASARAVGFVGQMELWRDRVDAVPNRSGELTAPFVTYATERSGV